MQQRTAEPCVELLEARVQQRIVDQIVDVSMQQAVEEVVEVVQIILQDGVSSIAVRHWVVRCVHLVAMSLSAGHAKASSCSRSHGGSVA